ncbi:hypothetical protein AQUCO_03200037v1 [Aquilegia coerulea]|uniref:Rhodanese domain-containing protein n=1 Tax=Aquilegia coerulea TaxID=218851 RepID=A0A2G5CZV4_AQUCA|nr:hypothetical protein AQUCO_03200037v1 [Aquilegia coerulea]
MVYRGSDPGYRRNTMFRLKRHEETNEKTFSPRVHPSLLVSTNFGLVRCIMTSTRVTADFATQSSSTNEPVVSVDWFHANLKDPDVKVLDASWYMPDEKRNPFQEYQVAHIPGALFFDVDGISDRASNLPHMLPREDAFAAAVSALGIQNKDGLVVYDGKGIFSAARVWWVSGFAVCHILAGKLRLKDLRGLLTKMLEDQGPGSARLLCEILQSSFKDWKFTSMVWDMLANVYAKSEMVHDALVMLDKMKDLNFQASISTYNNLMHNLRHTDMIWEIYNEIRDSGVPQSMYTYTIFIDSLRKHSRLKDAVDFFRKTTGKEFRPCVVSFNTLMSGLCNMGFVDVAKSFFCMMYKCGVLPDCYSYNTLIHGLCRVGSVEEALDFCDDMLENGVEPDVVTYNIFANGLRLLGSMSGACMVVQNMLLKGLSPDQVTYAILMCGRCQSGNIEEVMKLKEQMLVQGLQLSRVCYNVILICFCRSGNVNEALRIFDDMEASGLEGDLITYSILVHRLFKEGEIEKAMQVYRKMQSKGIIINSYAHDAILSSLCKRGRVVEARAFFNTLTKVSEILLYNIMIDGYAKIGQIDQAVQLFGEIIDSGLTPTISTYNSLIYVFCKNEKLDEAKGLLQTLIIHGLLPTAMTYTTLRNAYSRKGNMDVVLQLFSEMERNYVPPTVVTYTVIIKGFCEQRRLRHALQVFEDMQTRGLIPDQIVFNTLIKGFCEVKNMGAAKRLLMRMLLDNLQPSPVTYNILISGLCMERNLKGADTLLGTLHNMDITLTKTAYSTIIKAHCVKGSASKTVMLFNEMRDMGHAISIRDSVINRLCKRCHIDEVKIIFRLMLLDRISPDQDLCVVMIKAFCHGGDKISVFELFAEMIKSRTALI